MQCFVCKKQIEHSYLRIYKGYKYEDMKLCRCCFEDYFVSSSDIPLNSNICCICKGFGIIDLDWHNIMLHYVNVPTDYSCICGMHNDCFERATGIKLKELK